jgi:predicted PurR-regulated permease PerM
VLGIVYLIILGVMAAILIPIGSKIAEEAASLAAKLPDALKQDPLGQFPLPGWLEPVRPRLTEMLQDRVQELDKNVLPTLTSAGSHIVSGLGNLLSFILVPILAFFFLKDGARMRREAVAMFTQSTRNMVNDILEDLHHMLQRYIRALVLLSAATFLSHITVLSLMGVPFAILLAGIAAILEFIPVIGPVTAGAVILLVAAFSGYHHLLWIFFFLLAYRIFQDYVLNPQLMGSGVEIHPVLVLFGVIAGEQIAGIPGMFFSVPALAALRLILKRIHQGAPVSENRDAF